ncbi:MAG TPA: 30S ribosomal protein S11 [Candidatus Angelobacter sp.]|nr:30S ribosomal protein S11 [Candidatus Angelobacter sp.]
MVEEATITTTPKTTVKARKKQHRSVPSGQLHIQATFNNTIVTLSDKKGNVITTSSAGASGFRGSKKGTAYASQIAAEKVAELAKTKYDVKSVDVFVKGVGLGRDAAIRAMSNYEITVDSIKDVTAMAHGGVRPRRARRA